MNQVNEMGPVPFFGTIPFLLLLLFRNYNDKSATAEMDSRNQAVIKVAVARMKC